MGVPTKHSIIGQYVNGRNAQDDFLQLADNHGGTVFGWIDYLGHLQGSLLFGTGGGSIVGTAGQSVFFSGTNAVSGGTVELDMSGFTGTDLGDIMNQCAAALPATGGICKGNNLTGALVLSTPVSTTIPVVYTFCGQQISQTANVALAAANSAVIGCPGANTIFTKAANIDQFTLDAANVTVKFLQLDGVKGSFSGNGVVTAAGASQALIAGNTISEQANDAIKDDSATFSVNIITENSLFSWGVHAFESTSTSQQSIFSNNYALGDGTSTGAAILNGGSSSLLGNYIKDSNGFATVDTTTSAQAHPVIGNRLNHTNGWPALTMNGNSKVSGNTINGGGANGPALLATGSGGIISSNGISATNGDGIRLSSANVYAVAANNISLNLSGVSNKCGINVTGDTIMVHTKNNSIQISDNAADTNYGICDAPTSGHNLDMIFDGDMISTTLSGGATVHGFFLNNAANLNTNWSVTVANFACVHLNDCLKRTDTQNNKTTYINIQPGDSTLDAGTGSTADVFAFDNLNFTFATLPSPAGNGSRLYCTDCHPTSPTTSGGTGAFLVRSAGAWNGI